jgi:hypothetical protein
MQGETTDPTEIPRQRLRRAEAAEYARRRLGQSVKVNTLRSWKIPYRQIGRDAVYEIEDLDRFFDARLAAAPRRGAAPALDLAAMVEARRKLLVANVGETEGRLRAIEHTIGEYRRAHPRCSPETAKQAVLQAIAESKEKP